MCYEVVYEIENGSQQFAADARCSQARDEVLHQATCWRHLVCAMPDLDIMVTCRQICMRHGRLGVMLQGLTPACCASIDIFILKVSRHADVQADLHEAWAAGRHASGPDTSLMRWQHLESEVAKVHPFPLLRAASNVYGWHCLLAAPVKQPQQDVSCVTGQISWCSLSVRRSAVSADHGCALDRQGHPGRRWP